MPPIVCCSRRCGQSEDFPVRKGCDGSSPCSVRLLFVLSIARADVHLGFRLSTALLLRKEVIQPQVPLRLPCYDFIPITTHTFDTYPLAVESAASGADGFHDVTGGVYKARDRIHGAVADAPLLANPTSWSRVADSNLNWGRLWGLAPPRGIASLCTGHCSTCAAPGVRAILT